MMTAASTAPVVAIVGTGNFATNLAALCASFGLETAFFVDEFRGEDFLEKPVFKAAELTSDAGTSVVKWVVAISHAEYRRAAVARLLKQGVVAERIMVLVDDPALQILRLMFEEHGQAAVQKFCAAGCVSVGDLENAMLRSAWGPVLESLVADRPTIGLGYYGRGGGFRRHISSLIPLLEDRFNVLTMSDEVMGKAEEASRHLYMSTDAACALDCLDLVLSAHVFPCSPPSVPRVSFSHVIYDLNLTAEYHASRIAQSETHYLFASSKPCFDWYVDLARRFELKNRICVVPGGYMQLDRNLALIGDYEGPRESIVYAPTLALADYPHRDLVSSIGSGPGILRALLAAFPKHTIIFRPHPSDLRLFELARSDERAEVFRRMLEICRDEPRCQLDDDATSYVNSYRQAGLLVSDCSSTAFTFAFTTGRPTVFFSPREKDLVGTLGAELQFIQDRDKVGAVVTDLSELGPTVERLLQISAKKQQSIRAFGDQMVFNRASSAQYFVENIGFMLNGEQHPDWHYINW